MIYRALLPIVRFVFMFTIFLGSYSNAEPADVDEVRVRPGHPIGATINIGGISSMTFEGRFLYGLWPHVTLVASPSYQNTPELPFYHPKRGHWSVFDFRRVNLGLGIRGNFNEFDTWDGFFIEGMARGGVTWIGNEKALGSIIPSVIFGYTAVYKSGYTASFGVGVEWEFLLGKASGYYSDFIKTAYYGISKLPLTGEISLGWTW